MASDLYKRLAKKLSLSPTALVPPAFACLFAAFRYLLLYGGRGGAKSWSIARALLVQGQDAKLRILICREIMGSIQASAWQLLKDQIELLGLGEHYTVQTDRIIGCNGTEIFFEGLCANSQKIKSYESIDILWIEEAATVSDMSWETLRPTMRKAGSRIIVSWNPLTKSDPVMRFVTNPMPRSIIKKVGWEDNPHLSAEAHEERLWLQKVDPDLYRHVWDGEPREVSDALILKGKYAVEPFEVRPEWSGPYIGLDYGFGADPCAATECYIDDATRTLYIKREYWALHIDIDALPQQLEMAIPGISRQDVQADSSRPETTHHLQKNGIPGVRSAEKWSGSVDDGILYLRARSRIVLDPSCKHTLDEMQTYSFKLDPKTNLPIPKPIDAHNHCIDSLRYALGPLIRNQPTGGFFSRAALLVAGEPVETGGKFDRPRRVFATVAMSDRPGTGVGVVWFASNPHGGAPLRCLDYELAEVDAVFATPDWLAGVLARGAALAAELVALDPIARCWIEEGDLFEALRIVFENRLTHQFTPQRPPYDLARVETAQLLSSDGTRPLITLDERAAELRATLLAGRTVKLARSAYVRQLTHRSVTANHLLNQLLGYRPGAQDAPQELVGAFLLGCLLTRGGAVATQQREVTVAGPEGAPPPPSPPPVPPPPPAPRDPSLPAPRTYLAVHGCLPPDPSSRPGTLRVR